MIGTTNTSLFHCLFTHNKCSGNLQKLIETQDSELATLKREREAVSTRVSTCAIELEGANKTISRLRSELDSVIQSAGVKFDASQVC